jgi:hypothetical protein
MTRSWAWVLGVCLGVVVAARARGVEPPGDEPLEFVRVTVPAERLRDVPLDGGRLVPMPLVEFDRAVAALLPAAAGRAPRPLAAAARYRLTADDRGRLSGRMEFDLEDTSAALGSAVPLGDVAVERAVIESADGVGEAVVFGIPGGRVAIKTPSAGTYAGDIVCQPVAAGEFRLPLVPALVTRLDLRLPASARPVVIQRAEGTALVSPAAAAGDWRIDVVGVDVLELAIVPRDEGQPRVRCWSRVVVRGRQLDVATRIVPDGPWRAGAITLRRDATLEVIGCRPADPARRPLRPIAADARTLDIDVPTGLAGTLVPLDLVGVAEARLDEPFAVPMIRPPVDRWAGGGATLLVDPAFAVAALDLEECVVVAPSAADGWPVADGGPTVRGDAAVVHLEQQSAAARATVTIERRTPRLDTARVTTLELSPGAVLGRAACDVRIASGEAFVITGRVAPEWFIDSVEAVEWSASAPLADGDRPLPAAERDRTLDWRVVRTPDASELRIGLAEAATPSRPLGLRITGHRRGVPIGAEFRTADLDMVRLEGETAESALIDYRVGPDAVIEFEGAAMGVAAADERLAALAEPGAPRGRIRGGEAAAGGMARLVRRRPPLHADVVVQVVTRDSRITESLAFTCRPDAGAVDSVVVTVSEPLGDAVEWSIVDPHSGALYARRLEPGGGPADEAATGQESWLVEFRPAVEGPVTFRATRTRPFTAAVAVPLAWVDGATAARGTLVVRGAGGIRPNVIHRGLAERPPQLPDDRSAAVVTELSYGSAAELPRRSVEPPVLVVPPDVAEARAWVWRESTTAWCHDSGRIECATLFDIENRGRADVALTVPAGLRLDEVSIDGEPAPFDVPSEAGGTTSVPLPTGRGRVRLHVRGVVARDPAFGVWRIDPIACAIDVPVLDRDRELKMPADLELFAPGQTNAAEQGWVERLFDAAVVRPGSESLEPSADEAGFRSVAVPPSGGAGVGGVLVIRRRLVSTASIVAAAVMAAVVALAARRRQPVAALAVVGLAVAALWMPAPIAVVARAAWWGGLGGLWFGAATGRPRLAAVGLVFVILLSFPAARAADPEPVRVFVSPAADGGMALVPERLFRRLSVAAAETESVRVRGCRLAAAPQGRWRLELDIDSDHGGVLTLDQRDPGVAWERPSAAAAAGVTVDISADAATARIVTVVAGFHRVVLDLVTRPVTVGGLDVVTLRLPPAAVAVVETTAAAAATDASHADHWQCDRGDAAGGWRPVAGAGGLFDVSRAERVRLVRSADPRHPLAAQPEEARSVNEVWWGEGTCVVKATFEIPAGRPRLRWLALRADRPLSPGGDGGHPPLVPVGAGRYLVELHEPAAGPVRLDLVFAMPLDDPAGVFDVPGVWLDGVGTDTRTVRCSAAAGLELTPELPVGFALLRPREGEPLEAVAAWRSEAVAAPAESNEPAVEGGPANDRPRARVSVRRTPPPPRITQRLDVELSADLVELALDCQIDSRGGPFTGVSIELPTDAVVERVTLMGDGHDVGDAVEAHVSRPVADRLILATQQPRPGTYRLSIAAHVAGPLRPAGRIPLVRCAVADGPPLVVRWRTRAGIDVAIDPAGERAASAESADLVDVAAGEPGPAYELVSPDDGELAVPDREQVPPPAAAPAEVPLGNALEATIVHVAIDEGGRIWGLARFEVVAAEPVVRLRFPAGMRLFDVLVDGREAQAVPAASAAWDVRLHDVRWPRSILAVFSGDVGSSIDSGAAVLLEPPRLEGLPGQDVLWTIDAPAGMRVRVAEPARAVDEGVWRAAVVELRRRIAGLFAAAVEGTLDGDRERLRGFATAREAGARPALEAEWERAIQAGPDRPRSRVWVIDRGLEGLTLRLVRPPAAATGSRGVATTAVVAAAVAGWLLATWRPAAWRVAVSAAWPWLLAAAGIAWMMTLRPILPGVALIAAGVVAVVVRRRPAVVSAESVSAALRS